MSEVVALIPARAGSKGAAGKNIRLLGGQPLMNWTIQACLKAEGIDRVIVSTDSAEYAELAKEAGAEATFLRPAEISRDLSTDYEFVMHALDWLIADGDEPSNIVHMRPTTPYRDPVLITKALHTFTHHAQATALRSVHEMGESSYKTFEIADTGQLQCVGSRRSELDGANDARQSFPTTYQANGYVDVLSVPFIRAQKKLHGDYVLPFVTPNVTEVDTEEDFAYLEYQLERDPDIADRLFAPIDKK